MGLASLKCTMQGNQLGNASVYRRAAENARGICAVRDKSHSQLDGSDGENGRNKRIGSEFKRKMSKINK
jgi:hypothetical protein